MTDVCPVCGEAYVSRTEKYPASEATLMTANEPARTCVRAGLKSTGPDPTLHIYRHGAFPWEDEL